MKKLLGVFVILVFLVSGCAAGPSNTQNTVLVEPSPTITQTALPSNTPEPTNTPKPTATLRPTATQTPVPEPVIFEGSGDKIISLDSPLTEPRILEISNSGSSNFVVKSYDEYGNYIDLLVNEIGKYQGKLLVGVLAREEPVSRFEITSSGNWMLTVYPFSIDYMDVVEIPGIYKGQGDSVVVIIGEPDIATFTTTEKDNFVVWAFTNNGRDLLLNEIGPYSGEKIMPSDVFLLTVHMNGSWKMDITSR